jgi:hypothetical protein
VLEECGNRQCKLCRFLADQIHEDKKALSQYEIRTFSYSGTIERDFFEETRRG